MDSKSGDKSRRERRKEARLEKNKKKFDSWVDHQKSRKLNKASQNLKSKNVKKFQNNSHVLEKMEVMLTDSNNGTDHSLEQPLIIDKSEVKLESSALTDSNTLKLVKRKKALVINSKTKFEEYLEMDKPEGFVSAEEDLRLEKKLAKKLKLKDGKLRGKDDGLNMLFDGVPSVLDSLDTGETQGAVVVSRQSFEKGTSCKKSRNCLSSEEELDGEKAGDSVDGESEPWNGTSVRSCKMELNSLSNSNSTPTIIGKSKKTKFEEYLEMDMQKGAVPSEEDLALESKLAKKLKVKEGKLGGDDDDINMLFEGIPSILDSLENEEIPNAEEAPRKSLDNSSILRKRKKKASKQGADAQMAVDSTTVLSHPVKSSDAGMGLDKVPMKTPVVEGNAKYVAPHLRLCVRNVSEEHSQIRRHVRGLLNRMSESNVEAITREVSTIFHSVGRSTGSQIISAEVLAACSSGPRGNEQYAAVYAAFVAGTSCMVGIDFGAKLLASLAKSFEDEYLKEDNLSMRNLILLFSYLYIFGVCSSDLIYDFLIMLSKRLTEVDVSTILTILQCCGMKLRSDDPTDMKNFILSVQNRVNELKSSSEHGQANMSGKRMEFMLETICDIKNNRKRPKEETVQHTRIKKWLQKLTVDEILIRGLKWSKLLDPDKKGQWWLSGDMALGRDDIEEVASKIDMEIPETQKMLQLAATQRMNTDARRAIFCIIMSGEDYVDTFEKLLRLDLPGKQDREIMRVIVECCLQEKVFNKYYCVLASKLCSHDKNHKFTLQYCLWDHFKELESMQLVRSMHLSKFVSEMLASYSISLAVLKVVDLNDTTQLTAKRIMHFRMLFEAIFEHPDRIIWNMFTRIAVTPEYETLRSGIEFFIRKYLVSSQKSFAEKFKIAKKALNNAEGVIL